MIQAILVHNFARFEQERRKVKEASAFKKDLASKKIVLKQAFDLGILFGINNSGRIITEKLKNAIEKSGYVSGI